MLIASRSSSAPPRVRFASILVLLCLLMGTLTGLAGPASAATSKRPSCRQSAEVTCTVGAHVKRFKKGKYGRMHGVHVKIFASPAAKKELMMKLMRKLPLKPMQAEKGATCAKAPRWACAHGRSSSRGGTRAGHERCMQSTICRAYNRYGALSRDATCFGVDSTYRRPACRPFALTHPAYDEWHGFTKRQIQVGGSVVLCGSLVGAGIASGVSGVGAPATVVLILGGLNCMWQLWRDVDPG